MSVPGGEERVKGGSLVVVVFAAEDIVERDVRSRKVGTLKIIIVAVLQSASAVFIHDDGISREW
jgi:hypothetical protein